MRVVIDSFKSYFENIKLVLGFSFLVLVVLLFSMSFFTYVIGGSGFIRYSDVLSLDISFYSGLLYSLAALISVFSVSFLSVAITLLVKLRRTLDDIGFLKMLHKFPKNVWKLMLAWLFLGAITFALGLASNYFSLPSAFSAFLMLLVWGFFIFLPQNLVLGEYSFFRALKESARFFVEKPGAVLKTYVFMVIGISCLLVFEVLLGQLKVFWLPPIISSLILFVFILPYVEFYKTNLYLSKYELLTSGIK